MSDVRRRMMQFLTYTALTLGVSWGAVALAAGSSGWPAPADVSEARFPMVLVAMLMGPAIVGIAMTWTSGGGRAVGELVASAKPWGFPTRWYAVALLATPATILGLLLGLSLFDPSFRPAVFTADDAWVTLATGVAVGLLGGFVEEIGWTGFATRTLVDDLGVLRTGLMIGAVWGLWHVPVTVWSAGDAAGAVDWTLLAPPLVFYALVLPVYRVALVWSWAGSRSLFVAGSMHASLTASTVFVLVPQVTGAALSAYYVGLAVILAVVLAAGSDRSPSRPGRRGGRGQAGSASEGRIISAR